MKKLDVIYGTSNKCFINKDLKYIELLEELKIEDLVKRVLNRNLKKISLIVVDFDFPSAFKLDKKELYKNFLLDFTDFFYEFENRYKVKVVYTNCNFEIPKKDFHINRLKAGNKNLTISSFEYYKLLDSAKNRHLNNSFLIHFCNKLKDISTYQLPFNIKFNEFKTIYGIDNELYLPLTETTPGEDSVIGKWGETSIIDKSLKLLKRSSILRPFPLFNNKISIAKNDKKNKIQIDCINCRKCAEYCPENLLPMFYYHYLKNDLFEEVEHLKIDKCILCGICDFVCPSNIPLKETINEFRDTEELAHEYK